ncbi:MAG: methylated-DNA--[protein]-cysteine S-methyltransferase [bacterium]|nr:methylated-DNA--[protein]-cysteine S-methyltransferase [bacterium]
MQHHKTVWYTAINSPLGKIYLAATDRGLAQVQFGKNSVQPLVLKELQVLEPTCSISESPVPFRNVIKWLKKYFAGEKVALRASGIKFDFSSGTPFQRTVWKTLCRIPYGQVRSYQWVAEQIGNPDSVRAVGQANGRNPLPILVPCHRVINKDGSLGGYSSGIEIKKKLLNIEGIAIKSKIPNPNAK